MRKNIESGICLWPMTWKSVFKQVLDMFWYVHFRPIIKKVEIYHYNEEILIRLNRHCSWQYINVVLLILKLCRKKNRFLFSWMFVFFCSSQVRLLLENGRCQNANETIPLVQVRNVIDYMPQLKYMLSGMLTSDVAAKRQRNS